MAFDQGRGSALVLVIFVSALTGSALAVQHQVGGAPGWSLPSLSHVNYTTWASTQKFVVDDTLYFNYSKAYHNVLEVTKSHFESCNATDPLSYHDDGDTIIRLNKTGTFYFICGIPTHCSLGQKVAVTVVKASSSSAVTPSTSPSHAVSPSASSSTPGASSPGASGTTATPGASSSPTSHPSGSAVKRTVSTVPAMAASFLGILLL